MQLSDLESKIGEVLQSDAQASWDTDETLIRNAVATGNFREGGNNLIALGIASLWVVFANLFASLIGKGNPSNHNEENN